MTIETPRRDIVPVQMLRGIAAAMVVVFHSSTQLARMGYAGVAHPGFAAGVDIFFVISGFIMWVSTEDAPGRSAGQFLLNRIIRIAPLYWTITLAVAAMALVAPRVLQSTLLQPGFLLESLVFVAAPNPASGLYEPMLVPGWTLNNEMFFYLLFAIGIAFSGGGAWRRGLIVATLILGAASAPYLVPGAPGVVLFYGNGIVLEFLLGIGVGVLWIRHRHRTHALRWLVVFAGFALLALGAMASPEVPRALRFGVPAALIVAGAAFATPIRSPLEWLGNISYSLYLSHGVTLSALGQAWRKVGLAGANPIFFEVASLLICVAVAALVYHAIERPLGRAIRTMAKVDPDRRRFRPAFKLG